MSTGYMGMQVTMGEGIQRLPIYLLIDCSTSMRGAPIAAVQQGLEQFVRELRADAFSMQTVHVGVITFDDDARMVTPGLVPANQFQAGQLTANGMTALGRAFTVLNQSLDTDIRPRRAGGERGDWKPLVFILTDGEPTDDWQGPRQAILDRQQGRVVNVITVGCGTGLDPQKLKAIAIGPAFLMDDSDASFRKFFDWVTQSTRKAAEHVSRPAGANQASPIAAPDPTVLQYIP